MFLEAMNISKLTYLLVFFLANNNIGAEGVIGVNWGRQNAQRLVPSMVVDMLLQNNVRHARIYNSQVDLLKAFSGSTINLTVTIFYTHKVNSASKAKEWVMEKGQFLKSCNVRRIFLGTYSLSTGINGTMNKTVVENAISALQYTQEAVKAAGYGDIKVILPQPFQVINSKTKPSEAEFRDEYKPYLLRMLNKMRDNNAPFCLELFPVPALRLLKIADEEFAFPDNKSTYVVTDVNGAVYTDVFMFAYDSVVWALEKFGFPDMRIVVSQIGMPTDGYPGANVSTAERFYKSLLPLVTSDKGSPKRPGSPIDVFVHSLTDENKNPSAQPYSRHWGIYRSNGEPKYKIDLTGQGRDIFPAKARGIMRMPKRWCVLDEDAPDFSDSKMEEAHQRACAEADCTSMFTGGSCSELNRTQKVSYAFNMLFQNYFQDERGCYHDGLAKVVTDNPSTGTCVFPVEVVRGVQDNFH